MNLSNLTTSGLIVLSSDVKTKAEAIDLLAQKLFEEGKVTSSKEFKDAVYAREELSETGMEDGLAIPHGKSDCVKEASFAVLQTNSPISDWESIDPSNEVQYVFMLAIPNAEAGSTHIELLAELMQRMSDSEYKKNLFASKNAEDFYENLDKELEEDTQEIEYTKTVVCVTACPAGIAHTYMAAEALIKAGKEMGVRVLVEKQGANGIEDRHTNENLKNADGAIFAVGVAVKNAERFNHLPQIKVPVAEPIKNAKALVERVLKKAETQKKGEFVGSSDDEEKPSVKKTIVESVMTGISYMIPLIIAGGMIGAFAVLLKNGFGLDELYNDSTSWLGMFRSLSTGLLSTLLIPVLSAYMAYSIGDKTALAPGFAAGFCANLIAGGFLAGMAGGLLAGYVVLLLKKYIPAKGTMAGFVSFWVYPVFATTIIGVLMILVIGKPIAWLNSALIGLLNGLGGANAVILGAVIGIMVSFDLGGPVNKAAYTFCAAAITEGVWIPYAVFACCKMVSGFAVTFATLTSKKMYTDEEIEVGKSTWILALAGITEGAIPFMMKDPINVIIALCTGSAIAGGIVAGMGIGLNVPGAGIFSIFMLSGGNAVVSAIVWLGAGILGGLVSGVMLKLLKKRKLKKQAK